MMMLPSLRSDHPGFFTVVVALVITHAGMAVDAALPHRHDDAIWTVAQDVLPQFWWWAIFHAASAALIIVGAYGPPETRLPGFQQFFLLRAGCLLSLVSFNALGVALFFAAMEHHLSFFPALAAVSLSMTSLAAFREPRYNPFHRSADFYDPPAPHRP